MLLFLADCLTTAGKCFCGLAIIAAGVVTVAVVTDSYRRYFR